MPLPPSPLACPLACMIQGAAALLFAVAALQDLALRLVPNAVPLAIAALGAALRILDGTVLPGLAAGLLVFAAAALCWRRGWLGGADVKLFGAGALLVPPALAAQFVLSACLAGGVLALAYAAGGRLATRTAPHRPRTEWRRPAGRLRRLVRLEQWRLRRGGPLPYAVAVSTGACFVMLRG